MELYTLSSNFIPKEDIGQFTSVIWTERYFSAGDFQLVVPAIPSQIKKLAKGTPLGLRGTKEIMMIETQTVESGLLTVTGSSLLRFLNERQSWFKNSEYDGSDTTVRLSAEYTDESTTAGQFISSAVDQVVINPVAYTSHWAPINLDWTRDKITGLQLGVIDANGTPKRLSLPLGPLYENIQRLAEEEGLGLKLYLESASSSTGYVLKFATYRGKDRTSDQTANLLIRLSPKLDSLNDVKEINSIANYKNVFYVLYKNEISTHYIPGLPIPTGFNRRVILVEAEDITLDPTKHAAYRAQTARNAIANHIYIQAVDGQISGDVGGYKFGDDYYLGDIIELEGFSGLLTKARVTEYIRSEDQFGERAYPTLSVLDPVFMGTEPDVEPDPDFDPGWDEDPDYDYDPDPEDSEQLPPPDPNDPPDHNPDPIPDFGEEPGNGNGDGGENGTADDALGGELILDPDNDWGGSYAPVWYQHYGRIYLEGSVYYGAYGDPEGRITIVGGVPAAARPAEDVAITLYPDMPNSDRLYGSFATLTGVVTTDGTISITPAPIWTGRIDLYVLLGNISWPINPPPEPALPADTVTQESLDEWLFADSSDAVIGAHGIRAHLDGQMTLNSSNQNIIRDLPTQYRTDHYDTLVIPGGTDWYTASIQESGWVNLRQQVSRPLIRAGQISQWLLGDEWGYAGIGGANPALSYWGLPTDVWWGGGPEGNMYLKGHWVPPVGSDVGSEFGFMLCYADDGADTQIWYTLTAEKRDDGQWWMYIGAVYYNVYLKFPVARLDTPAVPFWLPNGVSMNFSIEELNPNQVKLSTTVGGITTELEWPQHEEDFGELPVWPSQVGIASKWGAIATLIGTSDTPISVPDDIEGDVTPSPYDLPNFGFAEVGAEFNLDGLGWRVP